MSSLSSQRLPVLIITSEFPPGPGGIGTHAYHLAKNLDKHGFEIEVLTPQDYAHEREIQGFNSQQPFQVTRLRNLPTLLIDGSYRFVRALRTLRRFNPELLIASGERTLWLVSLLCRLSPRRWIAIGHGLEFGVRSRWRRWLTKVACNQADAVVCVSNYTAHRAKGTGVNPGQIIVIPNAGDERTYAPIAASQISEFLASLGLHDKRLLLTVGNVSQRKGQDVVIRSLPLITMKGQEVHYLMAGLPSLQKEHTQLAASLGVRDRVHFLGRLPTTTLVAAYNACDVFVMTSRHSREGDFEGFGIAAIEAALCAKPSVVTRGSGLAEAVIDGSTGILVQEDNPEETASAVMKLLSDRALRQELGDEARRRALASFTWGRCTKEYARLIADLTSSRSHQVMQ